MSMKIRREAVESLEWHYLIDLTAAQWEVWDATLSDRADRRTISIRLRATGGLAYLPARGTVGRYVLLPGESTWNWGETVEDAKAALIVARVMAGLDADTGEPVDGVL